MQKERRPNRQVARTKSWIFDALMILMNEKPYGKITVSDITEKAGIARPTFYRNFRDKSHVIFDCLSKTINTEILNIEKDKKEEWQKTIVLMFDYDYMIKNQKALKKILSTVDIEDHLYREVQKLPMSLLKKYRERLSEEEYLICRYKLCYQITGSLRVFFDWFINNMPMPVNDIVAALNAMNNPGTVRYQNLPDIVVRLSHVELRQPPAFPLTKFHP